MTKIITENFRVGVTKNLVESLETENYYAVASRSITKTENLSVDPISNTQVSKRDFQRKIIFGKRIDVATRGAGGTGFSNEAKYMFLDNPWEEGRVYDAYDDTKDIEKLNMIVSVQVADGNDYIILKCVDNNNGAVSRDIAAEIDPESYGFFTGSDGYVWHVMFTVTEEEADAYRTAGSLPVSEFTKGDGGYGDFNVVSTAKESVSRIVIESTQPSQFNQYLFGPATTIHDASDVKIENPDASLVTGKTKQVVVSASVVSGRSLYISNDAYKNMYLRAKSGINDGKLYEVKASRTLLAANSIILDIETEDTFNAQEIYQLVVKIDVSPSTLTGTRCKAYGKLDKFGTLVSVGFETRGTEYKYAEASIIYPPNLKGSTSVLDNPTILRAIVSPKGGHGSDPINEMATSKITLVSVFNGERVAIPNGNTYSVVGLLKNPTFTDPSTGEPIIPSKSGSHEFDNRTILQMNDVGGALVTGTALTNGGQLNNYIEQYVETIDIQDAVDGVSYTIVDKGNVDTNVWSLIGATSESVGSVFVSQRTAEIDATLYAKLAFARDAVDTADRGYDYSLEIIRGRIHDLKYENNVTSIFVVDYDGGHSNRFMPGKFYVKTLPTSISFINNMIANTVVHGPLDPYSGELLHFIDFSPISRSPDKNEKIKFTFDF
jgi:hypothetical protein